jgi:hypothetical protein
MLKKITVYLKHWSRRNQCLGVPVPETEHCSCAQMQKLKQHSIYISDDSDSWTVVVTKYLQLGESHFRRKYLLSQ